MITIIILIFVLIGISAITSELKVIRRKLEPNEEHYHEIYNTLIALKGTYVLLNCHLYDDTGIKMNLDGNYEFLLVDIDRDWILVKQSHNGMEVSALVHLNSIKTVESFRSL